MKILFVHSDFGTIVFRESDFVPRTGDKIALFNISPSPTVTDVICWPSNNQLKGLPDGHKFPHPDILILVN